MITPGHSKLSITHKCQLLIFSRTTYYSDNNEDESSDNLMLMLLIDVEYTRHPFYGSRKMVIYLKNPGYPVNHKRVQRLTRKMSIKFKAPKPNTSLARKGDNIYPYLLSGLDVDYDHQICSSDTT